MNSRWVEMTSGTSILECIRMMQEARQPAEQVVSDSPAMSPIEALRAIVEEVAGASQPISTDSYLPASLVHDARQAIEQYERDELVGISRRVAKEIGASESAASQA